MKPSETTSRGEVFPLHLPAEHGAWGILTVPFFCAAYVAVRANGASPTAMLLAAGSVLGLFLLRGSLERHGTWRALLSPGHLALGGMTGVAALALVVGYERYLLIALAGLGALLYAIQQWLVQRHNGDAEKRSLAAELTGAIVLTLSAPVASLATSGRLDDVAIRLWLLNLLFFAGGVLYVKYRVRGVLAHRPFPAWRERLAFAWPVFVYHLLLALFLGGAVWLDGQPASAMLLLAFVPAILRAYGLLFHLGKRFPIKRLGWTEVAHSVVFAVLLILAIGR